MVHTVMYTFVCPTAAEWTCSAALFSAVGGGEIITGAMWGPTQIPQGGVHLYLAENNSCIVLRGRVTIMKQKSIRILIWLSVCDLWNRPDHYWGGRTQHWDTIQRIRVVLQEESKNMTRSWLSFFLIHLREGFLNHSSGHQMVLQRQVWSMCCSSRQEDEGMRKWRGARINVITITLVSGRQTSDWWRL